MELENKHRPRGYVEISHFIDQLCNNQTFPHHITEPPEKAIDAFLEDAFRRRLSVIKGLLQKLESCKKNDYKASVIALILSRCEPTKTIPCIVDCIKNKNSSDHLRRRLLLVLEAFPNFTEIASLSAHFDDQDKICEQAVKSLLSCIGPNAENLDNLTEYLGENSASFYHSLINHLTHRIDEQSIWLLGYFAEFPDIDVAEFAIKALGYRKSPIAYEILDNLIIHRESKKNIIAESLNQLTQKGISKISYKVLTPHKSYLSWLDGYGNRMLLISRKVGKGRLSMVTFILNEVNGFQDCSVWPDISNFELQSMIKGWEHEVGLKQIDYSVGVNIVKDSLSTLVKNKLPLSPSFLSARRIFGSQRLEPKPYRVNLIELGIEHVKAKLEKLLQDSGELVQSFPFKEWWLDTKECYEYVKGKRSLAQGGKIRQNVLNQFIKTILEDKRQIFARRFILTADFMQQISPRLYREQIETCLALYLAMTDELKFEKIAFMEQLGILTIQQVQKNMDKENVKAVC